MKEEFLEEIEELKKIAPKNDNHIDLNYQIFNKLLELSNKGYYFSTVLDSKEYKNSKNYPNKKYYVLEGGNSTHYWIRTTFWKFEKKPKDLHPIRFGFKNKTGKWDIAFSWKKSEKDKPDMIRKFENKIGKELSFAFSNKKGEYNDETKPYDQKLNNINFDDIPKYIDIISELIDEERITKEDFKYSFTNRFNFIKGKLGLEIGSIDNQIDNIIKLNDKKSIDEINEEIRKEEEKGENNKESSKMKRVKVLIRNKKLSLLIKERAEYTCESCNSIGFETKYKNGYNYMEAHHLHELAYGGKDIGDNMVCLCIECHGKIHHGNKEIQEKIYSDLEKNK